MRRLAFASADTAEFVDYQSSQDWLAVYGHLPERERWSAPWTTASGARTYYERIGRIDAATEAYAREGKRTQRAVDEYRKVKVLERVLEDILEHHLDALETRLELLPDGRQYPTAVGPIDLLAKDREGLYVVIELKRDQRTSDAVVGQILRYMEWVAQRLCRGRQSAVRGIVVGADFDRRFDAAIAQVKRVSPYTFDLRIFCEPWSTDRKPARGKG